MIVVSVEGIVQIPADGVIIRRNSELEPDQLKRLIELGNPDDLVVCRLEALKKLLQGARS